MCEGLVLGLYVCMWDGTAGLMAEHSWDCQDGDIRGEKIKMDLYRRCKERDFKYQM